MGKDKAADAFCEEIDTHLRKIDAEWGDKEEQTKNINKINLSKIYKESGIDFNRYFFTGKFEDKIMFFEEMAKKSNEDIAYGPLPPQKNDRERYNLLPTFDGKNFFGHPGIFKKMEEEPKEGLISLARAIAEAEKQIKSVYKE